MTSLSVAKPFLNSETMCKTIFCNRDEVTTNLSSKQARTEGVKLAEDMDGTSTLEAAASSSEETEREPLE